MSGPGGLGSLCFFFSILIATCCGATTIFVSNTNGNDSNVGNASQPLKTIAQAIRRAQTGDIVELRAGIYGGAGNTDLFLDGITLTTNEGAIIDCGMVQGVRALSVVTNTEGSHTVISNLTIRNCWAKEAPAILLSGK